MAEYTRPIKKKLCSCELLLSITIGLSSLLKKLSLLLIVILIVLSLYSGWEIVLIMKEVLIVIKEVIVIYPITVYIYIYI